MPTLSTLLRYATVVFAGAIALGQAHAQGLSDRKISDQEILRALIWTGHYSVMSLEDPDVLYHNAVHDWQTSRHHQQTKELTDEQITELLTEGDAKRDSFGWAKLEDKSIGISIGVPTRLVKFLGAHNDNGGLRYDFEGALNYTLGVRYGDMSCANLDYQMRWFLRRIHPTFRAKYVDGYALGNSTSYVRAMCRTTGIVIAGIDIPKSESGTYAVVMSAMAESLSISRTFNPTASAQPKLDTPAPSPGDLITASASRPDSSGKPQSKADGSGRTDVVKRETREGADLSVEQVFAKVAPAVFVVRAGDRLGSAVAVGEHELLTNCHVVNDASQVSLTHDKTKMTADVVSMNEKADRCVLTTKEKLEKWVSVRPYDDIKVGERALTVGTPQGLDLTVADGIVSSKRTHEGRRLIQTSAPISQGSSGGGLFDAQGHLLGITSFQMRFGQNLNFAIAAEDYAK